MNKDMFSIGKRVMTIASCDGNSKIVGKSGYIAIVRNDRACVCFDEHIGGHGGTDYGRIAFGTEYGHCWWIDYHKLKLEENYIVELL